MRNPGQCFRYLRPSRAKYSKPKDRGKKKLRLLYFMTVPLWSLLGPKRGQGIVV